MSDSILKISKQARGDVQIVALDGSLDAKTTPQLNAELKATISAGHVKVVVDLTKLKYIASAGIGALFAGQKEAKGGGGDLRLAGANSEVQDVFDLLSFSAAFKMTPNLDEALKGF